MNRLAALTFNFAALALCAAPIVAQDHSFHAAGTAPLHVAGGAPVHAAGVPVVPGSFRPYGRVAVAPPPAPARRSHHRDFSRYGTRYGYGSAYGIPYYVPYDNAYDQPEDGEPYEQPQPPEPTENRTGPTIFEHNGQFPGAPPRYAEREEPPQAPAAAESRTPLAPTILVFRDGHQQEIENYAIAGSKLIVLGERPQKIALADLDVDATVKANDDRGVDFKLPNPS